MSSDAPRSPKQIISLLEAKPELRITWLEKELFHKLLSTAGFRTKYDASIDTTFWSNGQDSYTVAHLGNISFVVFERGKDILLTPSNGLTGKDEDIVGESLTENEVRAVFRKLLGTATTNDPNTISNEIRWNLLKKLPLDSWQNHHDESSHATLKPSMFVRVPALNEYNQLESALGFRAFWLGKIYTIDFLADTCQLLFERYEVDGSTHIIQCEYNIDDITRTRILPNSQIYLSDGTKRELLRPVADPQEGEYQSYFVLIEGKVVQLPEYALMTNFHMQDADPLQQLTNYEFHNPSFKFPRDQILACYAELQGATFGLDALVGSRVRLMAHQAEVITTVLSDDDCRYILADEVGLGKTIEACVILRATERRYEGLTTLIIAPESLVSQWHFELDNKFWKKLPIVSSLEQLMMCQPGDGFIVSTELIQQGEPDTCKQIAAIKWGMLIIDEAHHIHKLPSLYNALHLISKQAKHALILSATPIQRQAGEFLALLKLMDPARYDDIFPERFMQILDAQQPILDAVLDVRDYMSEDDFDAEEFVEIFTELSQHLEDETLPLLLNEVEKAPTANMQRHRALETLAYVSDSYRVEARILRNRRATLNIELSKREFDGHYSYTPNMRETTLCNDVYEYLENLTSKLNDIEHKFGLEYVRIVLNALFSSPDALHQVLTYRLQAIEGGIKMPSTEDWMLLNPASPRREMTRIRTITKRFHPLKNEAEIIERLLMDAEALIEEINEVLETTKFDKLTHPYRFAQIIQAIKDLLLRQAAGKVLLFSSWSSTLSALIPHLRRNISRIYQIVEFHSGMNEEALQNAAEKFQTTDDHNILLCDELGGEGRNFQMADIIIHIDLPWTPAQIEQRIGRVDRLGRTGKVKSILPYAKEHVEADLFEIWEDCFSLFSKSMSGMEIALENILTELLMAINDSVVNGLVKLREPMQQRAADIRKQVEKEAYYNDVAVDRYRRETFRRISERYRDGAILGRAYKQWSDQIGLTNSYNHDQDIVSYYPKQFNNKKMRNAQYIQPPNMKEALLRSGRVNSHILKGTFNRDKAVVHEEIIFFAPGSDDWTESILRNAFQADRGRCCAILRKSTQIEKPWLGFEFFYSLQVDPKPLFRLGFSPIHLPLAQEFLPLNSFRLLVGQDCEVLSEKHPYYQLTKKPFSHQCDIHLGKRSGAEPVLKAFQSQYPSDIWEQIINDVATVAEAHLVENVLEEYGFDNESAVAREKFTQRLNGQRAAIRWKARVQEADPEQALSKIEVFAPLYQALADGIFAPLIRLESVTYWNLQPQER